MILEAGTVKFNLAGQASDDGPDKYSWPSKLGVGEGLMTHPRKKKQKYYGDHRPYVQHGTNRGGEVFVLGSDSA